MIVAEGFLTCLGKLVGFVISVVGCLLFGCLGGYVAGFVKAVQLALEGAAVLFGFYGCKPVVGVVAVVGGYVVGQGGFGLPDPLVFKAYGFTVCGDLGKLVVFVVAVVVGFAFRVGKGLFVALVVVAVSECFAEWSVGDGFLGFTV